MPQILPETSAGGNIGSAFGQGLGQGLQLLLQNKMSQMAQQQQLARGSQFWKGLGLPDNLAIQFASAPEAVQKSLLDRLEGVNLGIQQPAQPVIEGQPQAAAQQGVSIGASPAERRHRELLNEQRLARVDKVAEKIEQQATPARQVVNLAKDALDVLNTGKAITGVAGRITPEFLQTEQGQELISKLKQIVLVRSQLGKGVPSRMRLILEEGAKAQIWQQPKVIKSILESMVKDPEIQKDIATAEAKNQVLEEYGDKLPANFNSLINKKAKEILKSQEQGKQNTFEELPPASQFEGKIAKNPATGERMKSVNGQWVPFTEGM